MMVKMIDTKKAQLASEIGIEINFSIIRDSVSFSSRRHAVLFQKIVAGFLVQVILQTFDQKVREGTIVHLT